ncbi:DUF4352 domain-containing protein [Nocardiopsis ansamitocini]|uniref:DUF4352 domain-containing protein n=1 Tax=Nocardiopsis ansamitocini TaxID=1670832 RepID=A0A9W6P4T1_9ACTN|nr:DUF4352 domain-containing protein [Nocardiopsis ansamitocini]GLU47156.1 hypothetical protein Nans01_15070 [Nocardiopsis ansamitocini]
MPSCRAENTGGEAQYFDGSDQKLLDAEGTEYADDTTAGIYLEDTDSFLNQVNPGNSVDVKVVFDIPEDVSPDRVELHGSMFSGGVTVGL